MRCANRLGRVHTRALCLQTRQGHNACEPTHLLPQSWAVPSWGVDRCTQAEADFRQLVDSVDGMQLQTAGQGVSTGIQVSPTTDAALKVELQHGQAEVWSKNMTNEAFLKPRMLEAVLSHAPCLHASNPDVPSAFGAPRQRGWRQTTLGCAVALHARTDLSAPCR